MKKERWQELEQRFAELTDMPEKARQAALVSLREADPEMCEDLEQLLAQDASRRDLTGVVGRLAAEAAASSSETRGANPTATADPMLGREIDGYRVESLLGEGGFGRVYAALQRQPVERPVALKVVKQGLDSGVVVDRFALERQALAAMKHPTIAQVFDAGTVDGRPYFVMELVEGEPITAYCRRLQLPVKARLDLFRSICAGVQHAHQRGVLHRDLKPSNLLVTEVDGEAQVKIIDFGIAKAMHGPLETLDRMTTRHQIVGTLEYMSPEQASFDDRQVDVRSDIYSLGVLLYELLTGSLPISPQDGADLALTEALRRIREVEPVRPSMRAQDRAARLRGDLDWITLKALEKDKDRRYDSVSALRTDITRHLEDLPVDAGPPSRTYRFGKFYRRHRAATWASALALFSLLAVLGATWASLQQVATERDRAVRAENQATLEAASARRVSDFLVELFEVVDPEMAQGREIPAREIVDRGARSLDALVETEPAQANRLLTVLGTVYSRLGSYEEAAELLQQAVDLSNDSDEGAAGAATDPSRDARLELARVQMHLSRVDEAEGIAGEELARRRQTYGARSVEAADALALLGEIRYRQSDTKHVELLEEALEIRREALGESHPDVAESYSALGQYAGYFNDWETATGHYRFAAEILEASLGSRHPRSIAVRTEWVRALAYEKRADEALALAEEVIEAAKAVYGDQHPAYGNALANLGTVHYRATGDQEAALASFTAALKVLRLTFEGSHQRVNEIRRRQGFALRGLERHEEALALQRQVLEDDIELHGLEHGMVMRQYFNVGMAARSAGRYELAIDYLRRHLVFNGDVWKENALYARPMHELALTLLEAGRFAEAEELLLRAQRLLTDHYSADHWATKAQVAQLVRLYERWGKPTERARWQEELERIEAAQAQAQEQAPQGSEES